MSKETAQSGRGWFLPLFGKVTGRTAVRSRDANDLVRRINAVGRMEITRGPQDRIHFSPDKILLELQQLPGNLNSTPGGGEGENNTINGIWCKVVSESGTTITVQQVTFTAGVETPVGGNFAIAKPFELQTTPADSPTIYPPYTAGNYLLAVTIAGSQTNLSGVSYMDANVNGRRWARELDVCTDAELGTTMLAKFHCSELY